MNASSSSTVSGLRPEHPKPRYACSSNLIEGVQVFEEFPDVFLNQFSSPHDSSSTPSVSSPSAGGSGVASPSGPTPVPLSSYPSSTSLTPNTTVVAPGSGTQAPGIYRFIVLFIYFNTNCYHLYSLYLFYLYSYIIIKQWEQHKEDMEPSKTNTEDHQYPHPTTLTPYWTCL